MTCEAAKWNKNYQKQHTGRYGGGLAAGLRCMSSIGPTKIKMSCLQGSPANQLMTDEIDSEFNKVAAKYPVAITAVTSWDDFRQTPPCFNFLLELWLEFVGGRQQVHQRKMNPNISNLTNWDSWHDDVIESILSC